MQRVFDPFNMPGSHRNTPIKIRVHCKNQSSSVSSIRENQHFSLESFTKLFQHYIYNKFIEDVKYVEPPAVHVLLKIRSGGCCRVPKEALRLETTPAPEDE